MAVDLFSMGGECGCAAKVPADSVSAMLRDMDLPSCPELLVGPKTLDDAGVYKISDAQCLVQTVDFFPPVARDPYVYGQIAAANSLSDVYAMGGKPLTALAIVCSPTKAFDLDVLAQITRGAVDKLREADVVLVGGHSVVDPQIKYGLAVTGTVAPDRIMDNAHARPGDVLILTKPLGTGITIMAIRAAMASADQEEMANRCMAALNRDAAQIACDLAVESCTDVTGFGFLGHARQMAEASGVRMEIWADEIPKLGGVLEYAAMGLLSAATYANRKYAGEAVEFDDGVELALQDLLFDPQTCGGLLISCPAEHSNDLIERAEARLPTSCSIVGRILPPDERATIRVMRKSSA